jgi:predicted DNA-binding transcriptional regulator AlpA
MSAQTPYAEKAAKLKAEATAKRKPVMADGERHAETAVFAVPSLQRVHDAHHVHGATAPPRKARAKKKRTGAPYQDAQARRAAARALPGTKLPSRDEVCAICNVSYPTIWVRMCKGQFPRPRVSGQKSFWLSTEVEAWLAALPRRRLKGDEGGANE